MIEGELKKILPIRDNVALPEGVDVRLPLIHKGMKTFEIRQGWEVFQGGKDRKGVNLSREEIYTIIGKAGDPIKLSSSFLWNAVNQTEYSSYAINHQNGIVGLGVFMIAFLSGIAAFIPPIIYGKMVNNRLKPNAKKS